MNGLSGPHSGARCLEKAWRQLSRRAGRKASDSSGGLSLRPAEENVEAEAKLSEAVERKRRPEGRGGRDRPMEVRIQQQAERYRELGSCEGGPSGAAEEAAPWLAVPQALAGSACSRSPSGPPSRPLPSKTLASH